jgi:hypothetical protein
MGTGMGKESPQLLNETGMRRHSPAGSRHVATRRRASTSTISNKALQPYPLKRNVPSLPLSSTCRTTGSVSPPGLWPLWPLPRFAPCLCFLLSPAPRPCRRHMFTLLPSSSALDERRLPDSLSPASTTRHGDQI